MSRVTCTALPVGVWPVLSFWLIVLRLAKGVRLCWRDLVFRTTLFLVCLTVLSGTLFYRSIEGWGWIDAVYFSVATIATVGYGDLAPTTDLGKIFTVFFMLVGIGLFVALVTQIARALTTTPASQTGMDPAETDRSPERPTDDL